MFMKKHFLVSMALLLTSIVAGAQDAKETTLPAWGKYLHIESGFVFPSGKVKDNIAIRQNVSSYFAEQSSSGRVFSSTDGFQFSARYELFNYKYRAGLSAGLRYQSFDTDVHGYAYSGSDFFYLRYSSQGADTRFARVKNITERNQFLTIPVELQIVPIKIQQMGLFGKLGVELGVANLGHSSALEFHKSEMMQFEQSILEGFGTAKSKMFSSVYASLGMRIGNPGRTNFTAEFFLPSLILSEDNFKLSQMESYSGFKVSVQIPLFKTNK